MSLLRWQGFQVEKSAALRDALSQLCHRFGAAAFEVVDYWPSDPDIVGIAPPGGHEPCVCVMTTGKAPGRYDVEYGSKVYTDCVIQGLEWAVETGLRAQKNA